MADVVDLTADSPAAAAAPPAARAAAARAARVARRSQSGGAVAEALRVEAAEPPPPAFPGVNQKRKKAAAAAKGGKRAKLVRSTSASSLSSGSGGASSARPRRGESRAQMSERLAQEAKLQRKRHKLCREARKRAEDKAKAEGKDAAAVEEAVTKEISKALCHHAFDDVALAAWEGAMIQFEDTEAAEESTIRDADAASRAEALALFDAFLAGSAGVRPADADKYRGKFSRTADAAVASLVQQAMQQRLKKQEKALAEMQRKQAEEKERREKEDPDEGLCSVCIDSPKDGVVLPCGHRFCYQCATQLLRKPCPSCRKKITKVIKTYG